jgi:hypothetical protein
MRNIPFPVRHSRQELKEETYTYGLWNISDPDVLSDRWETEELLTFKIKLMMVEDTPDQLSTSLRGAKAVAEFD